jgi:hypothetical protein
MLNSFIRTAGLALILGSFLFILGCSGGANPMTPPTGTSGSNQMAAYEGGTSLGEFALYLDSDSLDAKVEPVTRKNALDVTPWADIHIVGLQWDSVSRIWDIDVTIGNPSKYTAYGPWVVFRNTGDQKILDQDGFTWWQISPGGPTIRVPVVAFAKENPERAFYGNSVEPLHLRIHWPEGVNSWAPLYFIIDVSYPGPRQEPIVENLNFQPSPIPENVILNAFVWDWQVPPPTAPGLEVYVDLTPIGGPANEPLFDDGMHNDGMAGDGIWGCSFNAMPPEPVTLTVNANDWQSYHFENDVVLGGVGPQCLPMEVIDQGGMGGQPQPVQMIIRDFRTWEIVWNTVHPDQPVPVINFDATQVVVIGLGERPSTGYNLRIDCVQQENSPSGPTTMVVYTEEQPGPDCNVLWVITSPYQMVVTPKTEGEGNFNGVVSLYNCPQPECVPQRDLDRSNMSAIHSPLWRIIRNSRDWELFWFNEHQGEVFPEVDFSQEMVIVGMVGDRPSSGWGLNIDCVVYDENSDNIIVNATEIEPGPDCQVFWVITQPLHFIAVPFRETGEIVLNLNHAVDPCEPPPCVPIRPLSDGQHSNIHEPVQEMFFNQESWHQFWMSHDPTQLPPEVDWTSEYVIALMTGERNTGGYWINVNCVQLLEEPSSGRVTLVNWTEMIPGPECPVPDIITQPFFFFAVPQQENTRPDFMKHEEIYSCEPPPCVPMERLEQGFHSGVNEPFTAVIRDQAGWEQFWMMHKPDTPRPEVNFEMNMVVIACLGNRPSSGYTAQIDCVRLITDDPSQPPHVQVDYTESIPGRTCIVMPIETQPYDFMIVNRIEAEDQFTKMDVVYECD